LSTAADGRELPGRLPVGEARRLVLAGVSPLGTEGVRLEAALGRVGAEPVRTPDDVPAFDTSAMDGFAASSVDLPGELTVVGDSSAGSPWSGRLGPGTAVGISTGAQVPEGADTVVKIEDTEPGSGDPPVTVVVGKPVPAGQNIRWRAEIMSAGTPVMGAGTRIGAVEAGLLASTGTDPVACHTRPRIAIVATGDELVESGGPRAPGQIWNSNLPVISAMARSAGAEVASAAVAADSPEATVTALEAGMDSDLLVICGGVSVGDHDHVKGALSGLGAERIFWGLAMKPGRPAWFGIRGKTRILGLPGNPVSAMAVFAILGLPLLRLLGGESTAGVDAQPSAFLTAPVNRLSDRLLAAPCRMRQRDGRVELEPIAIKGSHDFISLSGVDSLAMIDPGDGRAEAGDLVPLVRLGGH
jgi:molybdopterin molybdotransferase